MGLANRVWEIVEVDTRGDPLSRLFDVSMMVLIALNVMAVVLGSVQEIESTYGRQLEVFELGSVIAFSAEYLARLWSCTSDPQFKSPLGGRIRFALRPMSLIDLAAVLPFYLTMVGVDLRSLRALRLFRLARIAKFGRYYTKLTLIQRVLSSKREELVLTTLLMGVLLIIASSLLFYIENGVQPDKFSSIPATMWWAVATLTTVGYGDIYPVTGLGRFVAGLIAILGVGMFALPTGILGAGFVEEIGKTKQRGAGHCPTCGQRIGKAREESTG